MAKDFDTMIDGMVQEVVLLYQERTGRDTTTEDELILEDLLVAFFQNKVGGVNA